MFKDMGSEEEYDPRKPEFILPATDEEVQRAKAQMLERQMSKLESLLAKRQPVKHRHIAQHYEQVLSEMRHAAGQGSGGTHARMRPQPTSSTSSARNFTHARVRSAPSATCYDTMVMAEDTPKVNSMPESKFHAPSGYLASVRHVENFVDQGAGHSSVEEKASANSLHSYNARTLARPTPDHQRRRPLTLPIVRRGQPTKHSSAMSSCASHQEDDGTEIEHVRGSTGGISI